jgi:hypothetical protein
MRLWIEPVYFGLIKIKQTRRKCRLMCGQAGGSAAREETYGKHRDKNGGTLCERGPNQRLALG